MKNETKLIKQLATCKEWARKARTTNEDRYLTDMGLLYTQVAIEQIINYLEMQSKYEKV